MTHTLKKIKDILAKVSNRIIEARQQEANRQIAQYLIREYPNESYEHILHTLNERKINEFYKQIQSTH